MADGGDVRLDQRQRLLRKELRTLLPVDKDDVSAIETIAARGYPAVEPILIDLLKWTRVDAWPVAKPARDFLASLGGQLATEVDEALGSSDVGLKAAVLRLHRQSVAKPARDFLASLGGQLATEVDEALVPATSGRAVESVELTTSGRREHRAADVAPHATDRAIMGSRSAGAASARAAWHRRPRVDAAWLGA